MPSDHLTGPLINLGVEPAEIAEVAVLVTESRLVASVVMIPLVSVKFPATETGAARLTPPLVLAISRS